MLSALRSKHGLWVSGGEASNGSLLKTTEAMERPGTKFVSGRGPKLPKPLSRHCLLKVHEDPINVKVSERARVLRCRLQGQGMKLYIFAVRDKF